MTLHVFCGPSLSAERVRELAPGAALHPPVAHGDLLRLGAAPGDLVLIIDGYWHHRAAVRHKEILMLLDDGVTVAGAASMGALRAAELHCFGMIGFGKVWEGYKSGQLDADDEVAVLHTLENQIVTEALVNLRAAIRGAAADGHISDDEAVKLVEVARSLPFTHRTWADLRHEAAAIGLAEPAAHVDEWHRTNHYNVKQRDAESALRWAVRLVARGTTSHGRACGSDSHETSYTMVWRAVFAPAGHPAAPAVPLTALMHHQQLYDRTFPGRWRDRVLAAIARAAGSDAQDIDKAAVLAAASQGLYADDLTPEQREFWLTEKEMRTLGSNEMLRRILVRSATWDTAWDVWPRTLKDAAGLLVNTSATAAAVGTALECNAAVAAVRRGYTVDNLARGRVEEHLMDRWALPMTVSSRERDAAARDRGFRDWANATASARVFYLGEKNRARKAAILEPLVLAHGTLPDRRPVDC